MNMIREKLLLVAPLILMCGGAHAWGAEEPKEVTGPVAVSGGAEITDIEVIRYKAGYSAKTADLSYTTITLWFPVETKRSNLLPYIMQLHDFGPVLDDTGQTLSSERRRGSIDRFRDEFIPEAIVGHAPRSGPTLSLRLDNPARGATKIRSIKGKVTFSLAKYETLTFELPQANAKLLDHPSLKHVTAEASLKSSDKGDSLVTLRATKGNGRIHDWGVAVDGQPLQRFYKKTLPVDPLGFECTQSYRGALPKGTKLWLQVAVPEDTKTFEFHFKDVELP